MEDAVASQERNPGLGRDLTNKAAKKAAMKALKAFAKTPVGMKILLILGMALVLLIILILFLGGMFIGALSQSGDASFTRGGQISAVGLASIPAEFLEYYHEAEEKYGVPWNVLAAVHRVETVFSTNMSESSAGAIGAMQFMPCTWVGWGHPTCKGLGKGDISESELKDPAVIAQYGGYGTDGDGDGIPDPWNTHDAIISAAKYLAANGAASGNIEKALFQYNNSQQYVDEVLAFANDYVEGGTQVVSAEGSVWPSPQATIVTSGFKIRWGKQHAGVDIAAPGDSTGLGIVAFMPGTVTFSGVRGGYGNCIMIDHGGGLVTLYGHMQSPSPLSVGEQVEAGQLIGKIGNTGSSQGAHLHFEIRINDSPVDPLPYLMAFGPTIQDGDIQEP
ncbi:MULTISPECIES: peptidoglycan DD-metalloendopeptidase family protein [Paenibacillus]|nr:peptidoglycan DD-metalloendopeptidase family protein [Paenibacillus rhizosphaerae]